MAAATAKRPGVWGIDVGQCALKAIRLEEVDGTISATAFDYIEHPKILNQPDADPDELTREALEKFLSRNDLEGDQIAIGVSGASGLARFVKLPPVDEKKIPDIVRFEAKQQIPFPLEEVVWGFQRLGGGTKSDNLVMDAEIGLFAMKRDMINRAIQQFKDVNVELHCIQMAPLALCNFLAHDQLGKGATKPGEEEEGNDEKECVIGLDIGTDSSNLVITDGERIIWQRPIPLGGNHFTRALTKDLKLTFAKAEHLKRNAVKSPDLRKILAALKPVLNDFVSEVQRSLGYFTNTHRDANVKYMLGMGNAFRLPGLQKYLQEKLQLEVRKLQRIERLEGEDSVTEAPQYVENILSFAVAHGLALQGLGAARIHTNLLPPEIAQERAIRRKKPWAVAAAAVLLLISPPMLLGYAAVHDSWSSPPVKSALVQLEQIGKAASKDVSDYGMAEGKAKTEKQKVLKLAGGVNERLNWLHLYNYINEALPQSDGSHLVEQAQSGARPYNKYFEGKGKEAYERWPELKAKLAEGIALTPKEQQDEEEVKKHLVQVQIEAVTALYSFGISGDFVTKLPPDNNFISSRPQPSSGQPFAPVGWLVEIRGYTYHEDKDAFVQNTLVENLIDLATGDDSRMPKGVKLHPEAAKMLHFKDKDGTIKSHVSNVWVKDILEDKYPEPGKFRLISSCQLANVMKMTGMPSGLGVGKVVGLTGGAAKKNVVFEPSQANWRPPTYSTAAESFGMGGTSGLPPPKATSIIPPLPGMPTPATPPPAAVSRTPRTEFVIIFIWQEPQ